MRNQDFKTPDQIYCLFLFLLRIDLIVNMTSGNMKYPCALKTQNYDTSQNKKCQQQQDFQKSEVSQYINVSNEPRLKRYIIIR